MSVKAAYRNGVFEPLERVDGAKTGTVYAVFFDDELHELGEMFGWRKASEKSFDFWNNPADAVYDKP